MEYVRVPGTSLKLNRGFIFIFNFFMTFIFETILKLQKVLELSYTLHPSFP